MKKLALMLVGLLFLAVSGTYAMTISSDEIYTEEEQNNEKTESTTGLDSFDKQFKLAAQYYFNGDLSKAENICDKLVVAYPDEEIAAELLNKITFLKQKEEEYKKVLIDTYLVELRKSVMEGNCYDGFLFLKRINNLTDNEEKTKYFLNVLNMEKENILSGFINEKDKKTFLKSLDAFVNEDFKKSTKLLYKLQDKYPQFSIYLSISRTKEFDWKNAERAEFLRKTAIERLQKNDFVSAKNAAQLLFMLDYNNIRARMLLEQIELEIED